MSRETYIGLHEQIQQSDLNLFWFHEGTVSTEPIVEELKTRPSRWCMGRYAVHVGKTYERTDVSPPVYFIIIGFELDEDFIWLKMKSDRPVQNYSKNAMLSHLEQKIANLSATKNFDSLGFGRVSDVIVSK